MVKIRSKYTHPDFQYTCFTIDGMNFGIGINCVKEIVRCRDLIPVVDAPDFIEGAVRLRSMAVPVVDLGRRFEVRGKSRPSRIIIVSVNGRITGLLVDEVRDIMTGGKELRPTKGNGDGCEPWSSCVETVLETGNGTVTVLDLARLFTPEELTLLDAPLKTDTNLRQAN